MTDTSAALEEQDRADGLDRAVVGAVIEDAGQILLLRRPAGDYMAGLWELPSGKVEPGESFLEALSREVTEETGLVVSEVTGYLGAFDYLSGSGKRTRQHTFTVTVNTAEKVTLTEHDEHQWAPVTAHLPVSDEVKELLTAV